MSRQLHSRGQQAWKLFAFSATTIVKTTQAFGAYHTKSVGRSRHNFAPLFDVPQCYFR